jgi:Na+/H+-translocating membrane pyrophosphatase
MDLIWLALAAGVLAMLVVAFLAQAILIESVRPRQMRKVADYIEAGAKISTEQQPLNLFKSFSGKFV